MDDTSGHDLDPGIHGDQLRLLGLLDEPEVGPRYLAGPAELPGGGLGPREGVRLVVGAGAHVPAALDGPIHVGVHGVDRLRHTVARHPANPNPPLLPGKCLLFLLRVSELHPTFQTFGTI